MARTVSAVFKFQGTIEDVTHVNSKTYGPHVRARKNSKTPFVMTAALAESRDRLQVCNQYLRPVFLALRPEGCDGRFWSRLVSRQFAELRAGRSLNLACLRGFDCNLQHPLGDVLKSNYDFSATVVHNQLQVRVRLDQHPHVADELPRTGYQLKVVAIFRDATKGTAHKEVALGPLTKYDSALEAVELQVPVPTAGGEYILLLGVVPHLQGQGATKVMSDVGMKVVWTGVVSRESGVGNPESGAESSESGVGGSRLTEVDGLTSLKVEKGEGERAVTTGSSEAGGGSSACPASAGLQGTGCLENQEARYQLPVAGYGMPTSSYGGGWAYTCSSTLTDAGLFAGRDGSGRAPGDKLIT